MKRKYILDLKHIDLADSEVINIEIQNGNIYVNCIDWKENKFSLFFEDFIEFQANINLYRDLSYGTSEPCDMKLIRSIYPEEDTNEICFDYKIYSAFSKGFALSILAYKLFLEQENDSEN